MLRLSTLLTEIRKNSELADLANVLDTVKSHGELLQEHEGKLDGTTRIKKLTLGSVEFTHEGTGDPFAGVSYQSGTVWAYISDTARNRLRVRIMNRKGAEVDWKFVDGDERPVWSDEL